MHSDFLAWREGWIQGGVPVADPPYFFIYKPTCKQDKKNEKIRYAPTSLKLRWRFRIFFKFSGPVSAELSREPYNSLQKGLIKPKSEIGLKYGWNKIRNA